MKTRTRTSLVASGVASAIGAMCAASLLVLAACAGSAPRGADVGDSGVRAGDQGAGSGVEVRMWVVDPAGAMAPAGPPRPGLREVLARYEGQTGSLSPSTVALWRSNGLRVMVVPRSELDALGESLNRIGPLHAQWLGESPRWTEAMRGPSWPRRAVIGMDNGPLELSPGSMRMLLRAWVAPEAGLIPAPTEGEGEASGEVRAETASTRAAVQVELMPQFLSSAPVRRESEFATREPTLLEAREEGVAFPRLALETLLTPGSVLVVVPAPAREAWAGAGEPVAVVDGGLGPLEPEPPSLGEAMLSDALRSEPRGTRVVLVIVPHAPHEFRVRAY